MPKYYTNSLSEIIGMYVADATTLAHHKGAESYWIKHKDFTYLPILRMFNVSHDNEVRLASGERISDDITTYNQNYRLTQMDEKLVEKININTTTNDNQVGTIMVALNFTGKRVTIVNSYGHPNSNSYGHPKSYAPLKLEPMNDYQGKLLLITLHTFKSKENMHRVYGLTNCIKKLKDRLVGKEDFRSKENMKMYDYILECYANAKTGVILDATDTYKVATLNVLDSGGLVGFGEESNTFHIRNLNIEIGFVA